MIAMMSVCNLVPCATTSNPTFEPWKITKKNKEEERKKIRKSQTPSHMVMAIFANL
jgi:hypothetical protein